MNQIIRLVIQVGCSIKPWTVSNQDACLCLQAPLLRCSFSRFSYIYALLAIKKGSCVLCSGLLHTKSTLKIWYQLPQPGTTLVIDLYYKNDFSLWKVLHSALQLVFHFCYDIHWTCMVNKSYFPHSLGTRGQRHGIN